jgi:hypothetical protein
MIHYRTYMQDRPIGGARLCDGDPRSDSRCRGNGGADDQTNRDIFEERVDMVLDCWTQPSVKLDGNYYKAPYPSYTGVRGYPAWKISRDAGTDASPDPFAQ